MEVSVVVAYATLQKQVEIPIKVPANCTLAIAIRRSGILEQFPEIKLGINRVGIYSKIAELDQLVKVGDRIEIYRPLVIDPKQARRMRAK